MARAAKSARGRGSIIVISAPSGSGKTSLVQRLLARVPRLRFSVSYTTRPPRRGEKHGRDYFFVSRREFRRMIAARELLEWATVFGHLYGTSRRQLREAQEAGQDILLDIDVQGHRQVRRRLPEAVSIFVLPPSFQELDRRLRHRHSDSPEVIARRLNDARQEIRHWREYDYLVVNDRLSKAARALQAIVEAAGLRREVQRNRAKEIAETFGG
ncbi:MAG: guanylate kinase [Acidobacteriia bacterium]|nr:guanylate kinase [Terriglobia bacterium]